MSAPGERGHLAICHLELVELASRIGQGGHDIDLDVYNLYAVTNDADDDMIATRYM